MKAKTLTKIMSSVLCAALTMQIGWGVRKETVHAVEIYDYNESTNTATFSCATGDNGCFYLDSNMHVISVDSSYTRKDWGAFTNNCNIVINCLRAANTMSTRQP